MASIRERQRGVWEVRAFVGRDGSGKPIQVSRTVRGGKKDARRVAAELTEKPAAVPGRQTVAELLAAWQAHRAPSWAPYTRRDQASRSRSICADRLGGTSIGRLQVTDVDAWLARQRAAGVPEGSLRNQLQALRAALTQAQRWAWIVANPAALAGSARSKRTPRGVMSTDEVIRVLAAAGEVHELAPVALRLAAITGARRGELAALQWSDLSGSKLTIDSALVVVFDGKGDQRRSIVADTPTKSGDRRVVAIDEETLELLAPFRAARAPWTAWMLSDTEAPPRPDRVGYWWRRSRELARIDPKWRLHDLRHWSATSALGSGYDLATVAGRLGHSDGSTTLRVYAHALADQDVAIADTLGAALKT